ncbi:hypothetical protein CEXT_507721 [Caerostris extrusa]|uniref:Uncharacterized protein n=1 Tax=Caerostris extrusa TaxID=172846 RepID=A0AAV4XBW9_CAEEX|nr:hypothetical protein CEXT_507721 [Caerostris extrusa]
MRAESRSLKGSVKGPLHFLLRPANDPPPSLCGRRLLVVAPPLSFAASSQKWEPQKNLFQGRCRVRNAGKEERKRKEMLIKQSCATWPLESRRISRLARSSPSLFPPSSSISPEQFPPSKKRRWSKIKAEIVGGGTAAVGNGYMVANAAQVLINIWQYFKVPRPKRKPSPISGLSSPPFSPLTRWTDARAGRPRDGCKGRMTLARIPVKNDPLPPFLYLVACEEFID